MDLSFRLSRSFLRRWWWAICLATSLWAALFTMLFLQWVNSPSGNQALRDAIGPTVQELAPGLQFHIEELHLTLDQRLHLQGIELSDGEDNLLATIETFELGYDLTGLYAANVPFFNIKIVKPDIEFRVLQNGRSNWDEALALEEKPKEPPSTDPWAGIGASIEQLSFVIEDGRFRTNAGGDNMIIDDIDLNLTAMVKKGRHINLNIDGFSAENKRYGRIQLRSQTSFINGNLIVDNFEVEHKNILLQVSGDLQTIETIPEFDVMFAIHLPKNVSRHWTEESLPAMPVDLEFKIKGDMETLDIKHILESEEGGYGLDASVNLALETWSARLNAYSLRISALAPEYLTDTLINGRFSLDGKGYSWPDDLQGKLSVDASGLRIHGESISEINLSAQVEKGIVTVSTCDVLTPVASLKLAGVADIDSQKYEFTPLIRVSDLSSLSRYGLPELKGRAFIEGPITFENGDVQRLSFNPTISISAFKGFDAAIQRIRGSFDIDGEDGNYTAKSNLDFKSLNYDAYQLNDLGLQVAGQYSADGDIRADIGLSLEQFTEAVSDPIQFEQLAGGVSLARIKGELDLESKGLVLRNAVIPQAKINVDDGPISFSLNGGDLNASLSLNDDGNEMMGLDLTADLDTGKWDISRFLFQVANGHRWKSAEPISFELTPKGLENMKLMLTSESASIHVLGGSPLNGHDLTLRFIEVDLTEIADTVNAYTDKELISDRIQGQLDLYLSIDGKSKELSRENHIRLTRFTYPGIVKQMDANVELHGSLYAPELNLKLGSVGRKPILSLTGHAPFSSDWSIDCQQSIEMTLAARPVSLKELSQLTSMLSPSPDVLGFDLSLHGRACNPMLRFNASADSPIGDMGDRVQLDLWASRDENQLEVNGLVQRNLNPEATLQGVVFGAFNEAVANVFSGRSLNYKSLDLKTDTKLMLNDLDLSAYTDILGTSLGVQGYLNGNVRAIGPVDNPDLKGELSGRNVTVGDSKIKNPKLILDATLEDARVEASALIDESGRFRLMASAPLNSKGKVKAAVELQNAPLSLLSAFEPDIKNTKGELSLKASVDGPIGKLDPKISLNVKGGSLDYSPLWMTFKDIDIKLDADAESIVLSQLHVSSSSEKNLLEAVGTLDGKGEFNWRDFQLGKGDLNLELDAFQIMDTPKNKLALTGGLALGYAPDSIKTTGELKVANGLITLDADFFQDSASLSLDPAITIYQKQAKKKEKRQVSKSLPLDLGLDLDLGRGLKLIVELPMADSYGGQLAKLSTIYVDSLFSGKLNIGMKKSKLEIYGEIESGRKGSFNAMGVGFNIDSAKISFVGEDYSNPVLLLRAIRPAGEYGNIIADLTGTAGTPNLGFSSEGGPRSYDQTDVMSLLLFGKPASELASSEGQAGALLIGAAMSSFGDSVSRFLGSGSLVDELKWDPTSDQLRIGKSIGERLFLTYERDSSADSDQNQNEVSLEWMIMNRMYAEFVTGDRNVSSADVYYRWVF